MNLHDLVLQNKIKTVINSGVLVNCSKDLYSKSVEYEKVPNRLFAVYAFSSTKMPSDDPLHGTLRNSVNAESFRDKSIIVSCALKTEDADAAALWMCTVDGQNQQFNYFPSEMLIGTNDWILSEVVVAVPATATTINYGIRLLSGTVWSTEPLLMEVDSQHGR